MSPHRPLGYPPNPAYGEGACHRRVVLDGAEGRVDASLADDFHRFDCLLLHDGAAITELSGQGIRVPTSLCAGSAELLADLVGLPLQTSSTVFYGNGRARRHCTHLYDLAVLAIGHARRGQERRVYEAIVPDETDRPVQLEIRANDTVVHSWTVKDGFILAPPMLAGHPLGRGMAHWAVQIFADDVLEAAIILTRTWLIAVGRRYLVASAIGKAITLNAALIGSCYAYDPGRAGDGIFMDSQV